MLTALCPSATISAQYAGMLRQVIEGATYRFSNKAIKLDQTFALAFAGIPCGRVGILHRSTRIRRGGKKPVSPPMKRCDCKPDLSEGHAAMGFSYFMAIAITNAALAEFEIAKNAGCRRRRAGYRPIGAISAASGPSGQNQPANWKKGRTLDSKSNEHMLNNLASVTIRACANLETA